MRVQSVLRQCMGVSNTAVKSAKWDGRITLDGQIAAANELVRAGQKLAIAFKDNQPIYQLKPYNLLLNIVYEDEHLYVIDKPAPLASQSGIQHPDDSLENALYAHLGCPADFVYRPVNRLDKGTSGLMVVAKDAYMQHRLQTLLHTSDFVRTYQAVVEGHPPEGEGIVNAPIAKENAASIKRVVSPDGKPSVTHYRMLLRGKKRSLLELTLETGRTHQIRVHLAFIGHPILGDKTYGKIQHRHEGWPMPRVMLHAERLRLDHPITGTPLDLRAPLPPDFFNLAEFLRERYGSRVVRRD